MKRIAIAALASLAACGGKYKAPPPQQSIALPDGSKLKPFVKAGNPSPYGLDQSGDKVYVALGNQHDDFSIAGPGFLAAIVPSTGATTLIDLGGSDGKQCEDPGFVRAAAGKVYATCFGEFGSTTGAAIVEVDPAKLAVSHTVRVPTNPAGVAVAPAKIWFGDALHGKVYSIDRKSWAVDAAPVNVHCPSTGGYEASVADVLVTGGDLFALCANDSGSILTRLDATTGAIKSDVKVGPIATGLAATGDGRIAVVNAGDNTLSLVSFGSNNSMTAATALTFSGKNDALQDVRARDNFLYTVESANNTAQKIDLNAKGGPRIVAEASFGDKANTWNILPLDDDQAIVTNLGTGTLAAAQWVVVP